MRPRSERADAAGFMVMRLLGRILLVVRGSIGCLTVADCLTITRRERHLGCQGRCQDELECEHVGDGYAHDAPQPKSGFASEHSGSPQARLPPSATGAPATSFYQTVKNPQSNNSATVRQDHMLRSRRRTDCVIGQRLHPLAYGRPGCRPGLRLISTHSSRRD